MEPHHLPQNTLQLQNSYDVYLHETIPWWTDISAEVRAELHLEPAEALQSCVADVVVIGGGVAGLSAALHARKAGAEVVLLEATRGLGRGATGRNAGILSAGINMGMADLEPGSPEAQFWPETTRALLNLVQEARCEGSILQAHLTGSLSLAESKRAARTLAREVKARTTVGVRAELWTPGQVAEYTQGRLNASQVIKAMWLPDEGRVQPLTLLAHLARKARQAGVQLLGGARVSSYEEAPGGTPTWRVLLASGATLEARGLLSAVGPTSRPNARIYALAFTSDLPENFPLFWDASPYTYTDYRAGCGRLTVSGGRYGKAGGSRYEEKYYQRLASGTRHWLPELAGQEPRYWWSVDLNVSAQMVPHLHPLSERVPGLAIEGLGALGVLPGLVLGERAGRQVARQVGFSRQYLLEQRD